MTLKVIFFLLHISQKLAFLLYHALQKSISLCNIWLTKENVQQLCENVCIVRQITFLPLFYSDIEEFTKNDISCWSRLRLTKNRNGKIVVQKFHNPLPFRIICGQEEGKYITQIMCVYTHIHTLSITDILTCNIVASMISGNPATLPHYITLPANVFPQTIPLQEIKKKSSTYLFFLFELSQAEKSR